VTSAAAAVAIFSAGVLYADPGHDRAAQVAVAQQVPALPSVSRFPSPSPTAVAPVPVNAPANEQKGSARAAPPVELSIPRLGIDQRLVKLQVKPNSELEVPKAYHDIGWWSTGPIPGQKGAAVMVGHVDSMKGPAIFYRLATLRKGATIAVRRADQTQVTFTVTKVESYPKNDFPDHLVYRTNGRPALHLVTCSGIYDPSTGYRDNVVVFADRVTS
jgi:sortase (surface protein transpeptidase)